MVRMSAALIVAGVGWVQGVPAAAQTSAPAENRVVYEATFFRTFSPANALQMIQRLPGFSIEKIDEDVRGFGRAAGNVVINGQRPSNKSDTIETILQRIPASRVLRIELAPGIAFGADYVAKPQVANIVLSSEGGVAGTLEGKLKREFTGIVLPEGSVSALVKHGASSFTASLALDNSDSTEEGYDRLVDLPSGTQQELRIKSNRIRDPEGRGSIGWALEEGPNRSAHINATVQVGRFSLSQTNHVIPADGDERHDTLFQRYFGRTVELSGDVTRPFMGGALKFVALASRRLRDRDDASREISDVTGFAGGVQQNQRDKREESLTRLVWTRPDWGGWSVEIGAETAYNRLAGLVSLYDIAADDTRTRIDLPIDDADVSEIRGEAFVNVGRDLAKALHLDFGLTYEASHLEVTGDVHARRTLKFLKPKATLDWRPGAWHGQISVQRTVSQLNFEDFVSVAEVANDRVNGGNAELEPQRAWEILASADRKILGDGRIKVEIGYNAVQKVLDRIPTPEGFDAPGNLGDGHELIARGNLDLPLGKVGIKGGRLSFYGSYVETSVHDPYTNQSRPFSGNARFYFTSQFRQDLGRFAWGVSLEGTSRSTTFRRDELDNFMGLDPVITGFVEYRPSRRSTFTLGFENLGNASASRYREFFTPDRTSPFPYASEVRVRNQHIRAYLSLKRSFG